MLYFVKYNNSIPFSIERLFQVTEFHPRYAYERQNLLADALDGFTHESTIKFEITDKKNVQ